MTEKLTVENGRLKVERVEGKDSLDLDLSEVDEVYFESSPHPDLAGALVLVTGDRVDVVRVDNDDSGSVLERLAQDTRPQSAPAPGNSDDTSAPGNKRNARRSQTA